MIRVKFITIFLFAIFLCFGCQSKTIESNTTDNSTLNTDLAEIEALKEENEILKEESELLPLTQPNSDDIMTTEPRPEIEPEPEPEPESEPILKTRIDTDFRNSKWGDDPETVMLYETAEFPFVGGEYIEPVIKDGKINYSDNEKYRPSSILFYQDKLAGLSVTLFYVFNSENKLHRAGYNIEESHTTNELYISDYDRLKDNLIQVYGQPYEDKIHQTSSLAEYTDAGSALKLGYYVYQAKWKNDVTEIILLMMADNYEIKTSLNYISVNLYREPDASGF